MCLFPVAHMRNNDQRLKSSEGYSLVDIMEEKNVGILNALPEFIQWATNHNLSNFFIVTDMNEVKNK